MLREVTIKRAIELYEAGQTVCCIIPDTDDPKEWSDYSLVGLTDYLSGVLFLANDEPAPAPEKNKKKPKEEIDVGKLYALADGNWSAAKIADEMNISTGTVYKYLKARETKDDQN